MALKGGGKEGAQLSAFIWDPFSRFMATKLNQLTSFVPPPPREPHAPPRKVLLIHAHPAGPKSFNGACFEAAKAALEGAGHQVKALSLYEEKFQPALTHDDFRQYMTPIGDRPGVADVKAQVELLRWCDAFVLVYPTWWYNMPAILKGWIDRCFLPHVAFTLPSPTNPVKPTVVGLCPSLTHIKKIGVISTYGSKLSVVRWVGDCGRRTLSRGVRPLLSPDCTLQWLGLYDADMSSQQEREAFLDKIRHVYEEF